MQNGTETMTAYNGFSALAKVRHKKKMRTNESRRKAPPTTALPAEVYTQRYTALHSIILGLIVIDSRGKL